MSKELERIRTEYRRRAADPRLAGRYSLLQPDALLALQSRERDALRLLRQGGINNLGNVDVLEVGCGSGGVLLEMLRWGVRPRRLHGCELLPERAVQARQRLPRATRVSIVDGGDLPYPDAHFDLVLQFTMFTSILDDNLRQRLARQMWRVLRPGAAILWYDFRFQGHNAAVRAIKPTEVKRLFPDGRFSIRRTTLAPPIARHLASTCWLASEILAELPWLRTHDLMLIQKTE